MLLASLLDSIVEFEHLPVLHIGGLTADSRTTQPGDLFLALTQDYIPQAIQRGAVAVMLDTPAQQHITYQGHIPILAVPNLRQYFAELAQRWWQDPCANLQLIGVTGTNGKTSCTHFLAQALHSMKHRCGIIGTLGNGIYGALQAAEMTTPDTLKLYQILAECRREKAEYVSLEVSSHALVQNRIAGLAFAVAIFTNLSRDHLDYHKNMQEYAAAKQRLFINYPVAQAIINVDDAAGQELLKLLDAQKVLTYSTHERDFHAPIVPDYYVTQVCYDPGGIKATIVTPDGVGDLVTAVSGEVNLSNLLAVTATLRVLGYQLPHILAALTKLQPVPGRMQIFGGKNNQPGVVLDYAHTPQALKQLLAQVALNCAGKLYCVFGCGGERDRGKRSLMGAIAEQYADQIILTNDNPRHEDPMQIINDILSGITQKNSVLVELERSQAISYALNNAQAGDYVVIAGKGAETYQCFGDKRVPFSDRWHIVKNLE